MQQKDEESDLIGFYPEFITQSGLRLRLGEIELAATGLGCGTH